MLLYPDIYFTIDLDSILKRGKVWRESTSVSGTSSGLAVGTVPYNRRYHVHSIFLYRDSGVYTFQGIDVYDATEEVRARLNEAATATVQGPLLLGSPIILEPGDEIRTEIKTHSDTGNLVLEAWIEEEVFEL